MENTFIITAGGIGKRMGTNLPKQFLLIENQPVLMHTLSNFHAFDKNAQIILTLPIEWMKEWEILCAKHAFTIPLEIVSGGIERFDSIQNALSSAHGKNIWIHDGVRPFVNHKTLQACKDALENHAAIIPVLPMKESIRWFNDEGNKSVPRSAYVLVQTPQCFHAATLKNAYKQNFSTEFTDDASVVEKNGQKITFVDGNEENIKITTPNDLQFAHFILSQMKMNASH